MTALTAPNSHSLPAWQDLTLPEQVGQLVVFHLTLDMAGVTDLPAFFERNPIGAIFAGGEVIEDGTNRFDHVQQAVAACQQASRIPLLVAADLENGGGDVIPGLTALPSPMALGATSDCDLAYRYGVAAAREGALAGINWALAPMADLNLHPLSSNVGNRALGDEAGKVIPMLQGFVHGLRDNGMAACAKTFPGDGSDYRDQHLTTTVNQLSKDDWMASYGRVFQSLIDDGVETIMTGHICLPAFQQPNAQGGFDPCTISRELVTGLLKEQMGFQGIVVSDALGMGGILCHRSQLDAAVDAFAAGTDMLLWPGPQFIERVVGELQAGRIPMSRLEDALTRIWRVKARFAGLPPQQDSAALGVGQAVARETAAASLTLLWNRSDALPLQPLRDQRILLLGVTHFDKAYDRFSQVKAGLENRGFQVDMERYLSPERLAQLLPAYDKIVVCLERQFHRSLGPMDLFGEVARNIWSCNACGMDRMVVVGFGSPYLAPWYFQQAQAAINAYSSVPATMNAVVAALCGEAGYPGSSPVRYDNRFGVRDLAAWRS
jgi:beta-N-acetylhexosaminidase